MPELCVITPIDFDDHEAFLGRSLEAHRGREGGEEAVAVFARQRSEAAAVLDLPAAPHPAGAYGCVDDRRVGDGRAGSRFLLRGELEMESSVPRVGTVENATTAAVALTRPGGLPSQNDPRIAQTPGRTAGANGLRSSWTAPNPAGHGRWPHTSRAFTAAARFSFDLRRDARQAIDKIPEAVPAGAAGDCHRAAAGARAFAESSANRWWSTPISLLPEIWMRH